MALESCGAEALPVRRALTAGLFMNSVKLVDTAYDPRQPSSAGVNTYSIIRSTGPGVRAARRPACVLLSCPLQKKGLRGASA